MNNKELSVLRTLELIKYFTLKGQKVIHYSDFINKDAQSLSLETPEGTTIEINHFRINFFYNGLKAKSSIIVDYGKGNSTNKEMKPTMQLNKLNSIKHRFIFTSEEFDKFPVKSKLDQLNTVIDNEYSMYIDKSIIIIIEGFSNKNAFETFMNRTYGNTSTSGTWKYYFNTAINEAKNGDFTRLNKYHHLIYKDEISSQDRISLLKKLVEEYWGDADFDDIDESSLFMNLVTTCPEQHKLALYNAFFANSAKLYKDAMDKLKDNKSNKLAVVKLLIQIFFSKQSASDLINIRNKVNNFREDEIIPIITRDYYYTHVFGPTYPLACGPIIDKDYISNGIKINYLKFRLTSYINNNPEMIPYVLSNGTELIGKIYKYEDIIGGFTCNENKENGIMQHKIYVFPAFAIFELNELISANISILDLIGHIVNQVSIFIPFFKIIQGINISANLIGLGVSFTGFILTDGFIKKVMQSNNQSAKAFIYGYQFFASFYGIKSLRQSYKSYKMMLVYDCESLIDLWGQAQTINFFLTYVNANDENYIKIKADMQEIINFKKQIK